MKTKQRLMAAATAVTMMAMMAVMGGVAPAAEPSILPGAEFNRGFEMGVRFGLAAYLNDPKEDSLPVVTRQAYQWYWTAVQPPARRPATPASTNQSSNARGNGELRVSNIESPLEFGDRTNIVFDLSLLSTNIERAAVSPAGDFTIGWVARAEDAPDRRILLQVVNTNSTMGHLMTSGNYALPLELKPSPSTNWYDLKWQGNMVSLVDAKTSPQNGEEAGPK